MVNPRQAAKPGGDCVCSRGVNGVRSGRYPLLSYGGWWSDLYSQVPYLLADGIMKANRSLGLFFGSSNRWQQ